MLDPEALTCLLVLLFIDEPKLNTTRLHRVLRNLCYHAPTRSWLMRALISIIQHSGDSMPNLLANTLCVEEKGKGKGKKSSATFPTTVANTPTVSSSSSSSIASVSGAFSNSQMPMEASSSTTTATTTTSLQSMQPDNATTPLGALGSRPGSGSWLSISLEAALGCRANVFQIHRAPGKKPTSSSATSHTTISIHPQAATVVCKHVLETMISLAKIFAFHFLPATKTKEVKGSENKDKEEHLNSESLAASAHKKSSTPTTAPTLIPVLGTSSFSASSSTLPPPTSLSAAQSSSPKAGKAQEVPAGGSSSSTLTSSSLPSRPTETRPENDFWNILVRLDNLSGKSKGKGKLSNRHANFLV